MTKEISSEPENILRDMLDKQRTLLNRYKVLEDMPAYPLDLMKKESQTLVKKTVGRMIEELAEAYTVQDNLFINLQQAQINSIEINRMLKEFNEEMADVFHFALELLILCDLDYDNLIEKLHDGLLFPIDDPAPFERICDAGQIIAGPLYMDYLAMKISSVTIQVYNLNLPLYMQGGIYQSHELLEYQAKILWWTTWKFNQVTNLLKHREWRQEEVYGLSKVELQEKLIDAFMNLIFYFNICNISPQGLYCSYVLKNIKNHERIDKGY